MLETREKLEKRVILGDGFDTACEYLLSNQTGIAALIKYGSTVYGKPTADSLDDFIVVVDNPKAFHDSQDNGRWHRFLNWLGPNFYQIHDDGHNIKEGVIGLNSFARACEKGSLYIAGRMQKPVQFAYFKDEGVEEVVKKAVGKARQRGVQLAVALCRRQFGFYDFAEQLVGLSYKADFRPFFETPTKVKDILDDGLDELRIIYEPILEESELVSRDRDEVYTAREGVRRLRARVYIFGNKVPFTLLNLKNGLTNKKAKEYMKRKLRRYREGRKVAKP